MEREPGEAGRTMGPEGSGDPSEGEQVGRWVGEASVGSAVLSKVGQAAWGPSPLKGPLRGSGRLPGVGLPWLA